MMAQRQIVLSRSVQLKPDVFSFCFTGIFFYCPAVLPYMQRLAKAQASVVAAEEGQKNTVPVHAMGVEQVLLWSAEVLVHRIRERHFSRSSRHGAVAIEFDKTLSDTDILRQAFEKVRMRRELN